MKSGCNEGEPLGHQAWALTWGARMAPAIAATVSLSLVTAAATPSADPGRHASDLILKTKSSASRRSSDSALIQLHSAPRDPH